MVSGLKKASWRSEYLLIKWTVDKGYGHGEQCRTAWKSRIVNDSDWLECQVLGVGRRGIIVVATGMSMGSQGGPWPEGPGVPK